MEKIDLRLKAFDRGSIFKSYPNDILNMSWAELIQSEVYGMRLDIRQSLDAIVESIESQKIT